MTTTVSRKTLYDQVWSEAMVRLAKRYGVSDVWLAKICRKHRIPRPPRGYWAKKEFGKAPPQTPLPDADNDCDIELRDPNQERVAAPAVRSETEMELAEELRKGSPVAVADTLRGSNRLVTLANQELQDAETDEHGLIIPPEGGALDIRASKSSLRRSLLIMDALLKALEQRGYRLSPGPTVHMLGVDLTFRISETLRVKRVQSEEHDLHGPYAFGHSRFDQQRVPSGDLVLQIDRRGRYWGLGWRRTWRDAPGRRLEDQLSKCIAGMLKFAARKKSREMEEEREVQARREEERRRQEEAARRAEIRRQFKAERARVASLMHEARDWQRSKTLREYIEARKNKCIAERGSIEPGGESAQWLDWATQQADRLDPLMPSPPSILDEHVGDDEEPKQYSFRSW